MSRKARNPLIPWRAMVGDQDPTLWLETARSTLLFHSHSAMHQAISEATGVSYHSVHKCLSGSRRPHRIPAAIRTCLDRWLSCVEAGCAPGIPDEYRAVPTERMCRLLPALMESYGTKSAVYEAVAARTGVQPATVRRYFYHNGQVSYAPLAVYREAQSMAHGPDGAASGPSYLADEQTRDLAHRLALKCQRVLVRWKSNGHDPELEMQYRCLRRALITTIKEQRAALPEGVLE